MSIKNLKPNKKSKYKQGYFPRVKATKYISESNDPIIYRSSLELNFMHWCENSIKVKKWESEPLFIPYYNPVTKKESKYWIDFIVFLNNDSCFLVEIKPHSKTKKPISNNKYLQKEFVINCAKWEATKKWGKQKNIGFKIITEKFFNKKY